jgi:hypothetical protein
MPTQLPSLFSKFQLSEDEMLLGMEFTYIQEAFIQNQMCAAAEQRIALDFSEEFLNDSLKKEAALTGEIRGLEYLLEISRLSRKAKTVES